MWNRPLWADLPVQCLCWWPSAVFGRARAWTSCHNWQKCASRSFEAVFTRRSYYSIAKRLCYLFSTQRLAQCQQSDWLLCGNAFHTKPKDDQKCASRNVHSTFRYEDGVLLKVSSRENMSTGSISQEEHNVCFIFDTAESLSNRAGEPACKKTYPITVLMVRLTSGLFPHKTLWGKIM